MPVMQRTDTVGYTALILIMCIGSEDNDVRKTLTTQVGMCFIHPPAYELTSWGMKRQLCKIPYLYNREMVVLNAPACSVYQCNQCLFLVWSEFNT